MMMMLMMMVKYKTNKCHTFVTLIRFIKDDDEENDDDDRRNIKHISVTSL